MTELSLKASALGDLEMELSGTRRALERVPSDRLAWSPHDKSFSLAGLVTHLAHVPTWMTWMLQSDAFDVDDSPPPPKEVESVAGALETFDKNVEDFLDAYAEADDAWLEGDWALKKGDQIISKQKRRDVLRMWGISHMIHHRGQLTVYLRLLDVPLPAIYGPSADENGG